MHELSVARSLIDLSSEHARRQGACRITKLYVRLGEMSVVLRSFYFCFEPAARGTMCEGAELAIEEVPLSVYCRHCRQRRIPASRFSFRCPDCGAPTSDVVTGREMQLIGMDLEFPSVDQGKHGSDEPRDHRTAVRN